MKIAIIGYGKMGHAVEEAAKSLGHKISCIIDTDNIHEFESDKFKKSDVAIEFTQPKEALGNILRCFAANVPVVSGTTGWQESMPEIKEMCNEGDGTLLWASNFSIGVNIFWAANRFIARMMNRFKQYDPSLMEIHHIHKLDHPSGTAITTAEQLVDILDRKDRWVEPEGQEIKKTDLVVNHIREANDAGTHVIRWESEQDLIELAHHAKSRMGFAYGAVMAAEWLKDHKSGFYTMNDILNFD